MVKIYCQSTSPSCACPPSRAWHCVTQNVHLFWYICFIWNSLEIRKLVKTYGRGLMLSMRGERKFSMVSLKIPSLSLSHTHILYNEMTLLIAPIRYHRQTVNTLVKGMNFLCCSWPVRFQRLQSIKA